MIDDGRLDAYEAFAPVYEAGVTGWNDSLARLLALAESFQPTVILWSHPRSVPLTANFLGRMRGLRSMPTVVLQDMDPWGTLRVRLTPPMRALVREADLVYLCGTGSLGRVFRRAGAKRIRYSFHGADLERYGRPWSPTTRRQFDVVMIANRNRGRVPGSAVPGAWRRARLADLLAHQYGQRFGLFGHGWDGNPSWRGPVAVDGQTEVNRQAWVSTTWDHFPGIATYTSNRVPISLISGIPHVNNYKAGYEAIYPPGSGLYWGTTVREVAEMVAVLLAMPRASLLAIGDDAARFAREHRSQEALMVRLIEDVSEYRRAVGGAAGGKACPQRSSVYARS